VIQITDIVPTKNYASRCYKLADHTPQIDKRATSAKHGLRPVPHRLHSLWV
jgi:hypothetical protein